MYIQLCMQLPLAILFRPRNIAVLSVILTPISLTALLFYRRERRKDGQRAILFKQRKVTRKMHI